MPLKKLLHLFLLTLFTFGALDATYAQSSKRYGGSFARNKRKFGGAKQNKSFKKAPKKSRKNIKKRQHISHRRSKSKSKVSRTKMVAKKSKRSSGSKHFKGRYPSSKNQFGTKLELVAGGGLILDNKTDVTENPFIQKGAADIATGYLVEAGLLYHLGNHIGLQSSVHYKSISSEQATLAFSGLGLYAKIHLTSYKKKLAPYLLGGVNIDYWSFEYEDFTEDLPFSNDENQVFATINRVEQKYDLYASSSEALYAWKIGGGFDYQVSKNIGTFVQGAYIVNEGSVYEVNISNIAVSVGLRLSLIKDKSLY